MSEPHRSAVAVLATMDTKRAEAEYVGGILRSLGHEVVLIDVGPLTPDAAGFDVGNAEVARSGGWELGRLIETGQRDLIIRTMGDGAGKVVRDLWAEGRLAAAIGIGGNQGSAIFSNAMSGLPIGFPKLLVSTVASGNIRPYIGFSDMAVMFSVADLVGGPNAVSGMVLNNAAGAISGMARASAGLPADGAGRKAVAVSALGNTEAAAAEISRLLNAAGYQAIVFHASGAGGSAMEDLIRRGLFAGVIDLTTHEVSEEFMGCGAYVPVRPGRLGVAGEMGIPQVISTGGLEYICFGPRESIPARLRRRRIYMHNPLNANLKLTRVEMAEVGRIMAERLSRAAGPAELLIPLVGWSVYGGPGGPLYDPEGNRSLTAALTGGLRNGFPVRMLDMHINDKAFAAACVESMLRLIHIT